MKIDLGILIISNLDTENKIQGLFLILSHKNNLDKFINFATQPKVSNSASFCPYPYLTRLILGSEKAFFHDQLHIIGALWLRDHKALHQGYPSVTSDVRRDIANNMCGTFSVK